MKKTLAILLTVAIVMAITIVAIAGPDPVPGNPAWNVKYISAQKLTPSLGPAANIPDNPRKNASGDKISSNAHSADFPGLYFYWNDKQKDDGVLLVLPEVFDLFVDGKFVLTAKNSNNYWGYTISPATGSLIDGVYAYGIPKQFQYISKDNKGKEKQEKEDLKNINMVFIDGKYKDAYFDIVKDWYNEKGKLITNQSVIDELNKLLKFNNGYVLGRNTVKITDYKSAWYGASVSVIEGAIKGYKVLNGTPDKYNLKVRWDDNPVKVAYFQNKKMWAHININKVWVDICECDPCLCTADQCVEIDGVMYHILPAPVGVVPEFTIDGAPAVWGDNKVKEGAYTVSESDIDGWMLISDNDIDVYVEAGETKTVSFYNLMLKYADVKVKKVWEQSWVGDPYDFDDFSVDFYDGDPADAGTITLPGNVAKFEYEFIGPYIEKSFTEDVDESNYLREDANYRYAWSLDRIEIYKDGVLVTTLFDAPADLALYNGDNYVIKFFNLVDRVPISNPTHIDDKIPSKQHVDRWWDKYGILAYGANSGTDKNDYIIAFSEDFWDINNSVTIAYGTGNNYLYTVTITYDSVNDVLVYSDPLFESRVLYYGSLYFDTHYVTPKEKNHEFKISIGALIANPYTSGAKQIWLVSIDAK